MKENKGTTCNVNRLKYTNLQQNNNNVVYKWVHREAGSDFAGQIDNKRESIACGAPGSLFEGDDKQIYNCHGARSSTNVGCGAVKAMPRRKVRKIYLPETDEIGVGVSDISLDRKFKNSQQNYVSTWTTSKCVGSFEINTNSEKERLAPVKYVSHATSSPIGGVHTEMAINTVPTRIAYASTQVEVEIEDKSNCKTYSTIETDTTHLIDTISKQIQYNKESAIIVTKGAPKPEHNRIVSSDSLVNIYNLEECDPQNKVLVDPMENKMEMEYRKIFSPHPTKQDSNGGSNSSNSNSKLPDKSASILRRRFEALRKGLSKKEDAKRESGEHSSQGSTASHKDASITSDPPSLECKSFTNTEKCIPYEAETNDHDIAEENELESQGAKGMFKLWGKKFNLEDDSNKKIEAIESTRKSSVPDNSVNSPSIEYSLHTPSMKFSKQNHPSILKSQIVEKNTSNNTSAQSSQKTNKKEQDGNKPKKFFFFKKKSKSKNKEQSFTNPCSTKKVTAGRCEIKNDMTLSLKNYGQSPKIHMKKITEDDELSKKPWLKRLMSNTLESARSVNVRWNNSMYATSSSTMFELIDTVYKNSNICRSSKSDTSQTSVNKCKPHIAPKPRHFARDIEAWMIPQTIIDNPQNLPIECYTKSINYYDTQDTTASKNIEVTISDQKWVIEKGRAVSHKIEVVLHTNNTFMANKKSSEYLRIDIPKDFFDITSSDSKRSQFSDEEVFNIVEYETDNTKHDDKPLYSGDHSSDIKVIVSVKSCKNEESTVIEKIVKRQPLRRDVLTQKSEVFVQKKCDVIGVGIITQRDLKEYHKSIRQEILEAESESVSEEDEIENHTGMTEKKCEFAESYLQDYYKHWAPGLDSYSWCLSDPLLVSASDKSLMSLLRQTDISKSCPNIGETSTLVSSAYGTSSCSIIDNKMILEKFKQLTNAEAAKNKEEADNKRILPKDSLEVFKRRKIYSQSLKSQWINDIKASSKSVPSLHNKSLKDTQDREKDPDGTITCIMKGRKRVSMTENETKRKESEVKKCTVIRFSKHPFVKDEPEIISLSSSSLQNCNSEDKIPEISSKSAFSTTSNSSFTVMKLKSPRKSLKSMWVPPKKDKPKCLTCSAQTGRSVTNSNISVRTLLSSETNECHSSKRRFAVSNIKDSLKNAISGSKCKFKCHKCSNTRLAGTRPICSECFSRESFTKSIRESKHKHHQREKKSKQKKSSNSHVGLYIPVKPTICTKCRAPLKYDKNNPKNAICPFCDLISPKQSKLLSKTNAVLKKCSQSLKISSSLFNRHNNTETRCCKNCKNNKKELLCSKCENNCKNTDSSQLPSSKSSAKSQLSVRYDIKQPDSKKNNSNANQPTRIKPNSVPPPPCMKPSSVPPPPCMKPSSVPTPPCRIPSSVLTPPCMKSSSVLTPPCLKPSSVQTPPYQKPSSVQTPPYLKPSLVKPPPCQKPCPSIAPPCQKPCPMKAQPSDKLSPVKAQPSPVTTPPRSTSSPLNAQSSPIKAQPSRKSSPVNAQSSPIKAQPCCKSSPIKAQPCCKSSPVSAQQSPINVQPSPTPRLIKALPSPKPSSIKSKPAPKCKSCPKCKNPLKYEVNNPERVLCPLCDLKSVESQESKKEQTESESNKCPICNNKLLFGDTCPVCEPDKPPEKTPVRSCCPGCQIHKDISLPKKSFENKTQNSCCPACKHEYNKNMGLYPLSSKSSTSDGSDSSCPKCKTKKYNKVIEGVCPRCPSTNDAPQPKPEEEETDKQKYCPKCKTGLNYASRNQVICEFCTSSSSSDDFINKALNQKSETGSTQMIFQPPITYDRNSSNEARCVVCANSSQSVIDIIRSRLKQTCVPKTCPLCNNPLKIDCNDSVIIKCRHLCKNRPDEADNKIEDGISFEITPRGKNSKEKLTKKVSKEKGSSDGPKEKSASEKGSTHQINKVSIEDVAVKKKKKDSVEQRRTCCPDCLDSPRKGICSHCGAQAKETKEKEKQEDGEPNLPQPASNMCSICKNIMKTEFNGICPQCAKSPVLNSGTSNSVTESDEEPKVKKSLFKIKTKKTLPIVCPNCSYPLNEKISDSKKTTKQDKTFKKDKTEDGAKGKPVKLKVKRDSLIVNKRQQEAKHKPEENSSSGILKRLTSSSTSMKECPCASHSDDCVCLIGDSIKPVNKKNITDEATPPKTQCACQDVEKTPDPKIEEGGKPEGNTETKLSDKSSSQSKIICKCKKSKSETKVQNSNSNFTISFAKVSKKTTSFEDSSLFEEKVNAITQYVEQRTSGIRCESDGSGCPCGRRSNLSRSDLSRELVMRTNRQKHKSGSAKRHKSKSDRHCLPHKKEHCGSECKKRRDTSECKKACIRKKKRDTSECMKDKTPPCKRPKSASPYSSVEDCKSKRRCRKSRDKSAPEGLTPDIMEDKNKDCHKHKHSTKCSDIAFSILRKRDSYGSVTKIFTPKHSKTKTQERHRSKIQPDEHCVNVCKKKKDIPECKKDDKPECKEREDTPECQKDPIPVCKRPLSATECKKPKPCKCAEKTSSHSLCKKKQKKDCNACNDIITVNTSSNPICKKTLKSQECNELKSVAVDNLSLHSLGKTPSQCKPEPCSKPKTPSKSPSSHSICKKTCKPEEPKSPPSIKTSSHLTGKLTCQSEECSKPSSIPAAKTSSHSLRIKTNSKDKECNKAKPIPDTKVSSHSLCESCKKGHKAKQGSKRLRDAAELQSPEKSQLGLLVRECSDVLEKGTLKYEPCYEKEVPASKKKTSDGSKTKHGSRKHRHHSGCKSKSKKDAVEMTSSVHIVLSGAKMPTLNTANTNKPKTCQCRLCEKMSAKQSLPKQVCLECDSSLFPHSNRCSKTNCLSKNKIAPYNNTPEVDKQCRCVVEKSSVVSPVNLVDQNSTATTDKTKVRLDVTSSKSTKKKLPLLIDWGKSSLKELKSEIKSALKSPLFSKRSINRNIKTSNRNSESIMKKLYENEFIIPSVEDPKTSQLKNEKHKVRHLPLCESLRNKLEKLKSMTNSAMKENYPWPLNNQNSVTQPNFTETLKCKSDKDIPKKKHDLVKKTSSTCHDEKSSRIDVSPLTTSGLLSDISYDLEDSKTISMIKKHCMAKYGLKNVSNSDSSTNAVIITSDDAPSNIETTATTKAANSYTRQWVSNNSDDSDDKQTKETRKPKAKESFLNRNRSLTSSILRKLRQKKPPDSHNELKIRLSSQKLPNMNFSVLDEDGDVIFERKEYSKGKRRHSVLEDMYKGSDISRMSAQAVIQNVVTDAQSETAGSDKSEATDDNTIEIQLKIVVGNSAETFKTSEHTVRGQQFSACALTIPTKSDTEKYIKCDNVTASKTSNDINIKIVIKNFKSDKKQDEENSISTTSKVNTVLTKFGDVYDQKVDKTYSVHRAAINRSSTNVKSSVNGLTMDRVENAEDTYTLNSEKTVDSTFNTENTQNITKGGVKEDVIEIKPKNRSKTRVQWAENTLKISDEKDKISEEPTEEIKTLALIEDKSSKSSSLKERKEMLKKVMAKATSKPKNKALVRELRDMLKIILTDSSDNEHENSALLPTNDGIISTESDGFYGTKTITACKIESNISSLRDSGPGSALEYKTFIATDSNSEESKIFKGCMCSKFLKKLSDSKSNLRCCCKQPTNQKDQETICVSLDEDTDSTKYCDAEIQNSIVISSTDENEKMNMSIKSFMTSITSYEKTVQNAIITKKRVEKTISKNKSYKEQRVRKLISSQIKTEFKESNTNLPKVSKFTRKSQKKRLPKPSEVLQCYETKKAVLEIYAEESPSLAGAHLVARLPKFVYGTGSEITRNYQAMASVCDQGYIVY